MKKMILFLLIPALCSCSLRLLGLRSTAALMERGASAFYEEPDPQLAKEAMGSQLKLLEALLRNEPGNPRLLLLSAEGFAGYSFLFLEEDQPERAKGLYLRARDYSLRLLARKKAFAGLQELDLESLEKTLQGAKEADVPALFWAAFSWAGYINLSRDSPEALVDLPKAVSIMKRALELKPGFYFAGPDLFFGTYYASRPALLGGDVQKAKIHFEEAIRQTQGRYLMAYVLKARHLAVASQDRELFQSLLTQVLETPSGFLADAMLADEVAKRKAKSLLERIDEYF